LFLFWQELKSIAQRVVIKINGLFMVLVVFCKNSFFY
jgi:hypothetical protein